MIAPRSASLPSPGRRHTTFARLVGAVGLITITALLFWLLTDDAFRVTEERVTFRGLAHADEAEVRAYLSDIERGPNVFRVRASDIVSDLSNLTEVDAAYAQVTLPADVSVQLDERDPVFIWSNGEVAWLVDEEGMLFAPGDSAITADDEPAADTADESDEPAGDTAAEPVDAPLDDGEASGATGPEDGADTTPTAGEAARAALPVVEDGRLVEEQPTVGTFLPEADLVVMRQLLALTPELLGSGSNELYLRVDERDGYVLESRDRGWRALFGSYTPTIQPPEDIPRQVQCLRWLLAAEERKLEQVRLALSEDACGTFTKFDEKPRKRN